MSAPIAPFFPISPYTTAASTSDSIQSETTKKEGLSWLTIASSKPFRFVVGPEKREFTVSSALVAHQSPTLRTLVEGDFSEARDRYVTLDWVDEDTFTRFIQYAYTGDYDAAEDVPMIVPVDRSGGRPARVQEPAPEPVKEPEPAKEESKPRRMGLKRQYRGEIPKKYLVESAKVRPGEHMTRVKKHQKECSYKTIDPDNKGKRGKRCLWEKFSQAANRFNLTKFALATNPEEDHSQIFLRHAKMYVFADYYGITDLTELSQNKLGQVLLPFKLRDERVADFVALMRYCYEEPAPEALQEFVMMYAACKAEVLWKDAGFQALVEETQELSFALVKQVMGE